MTTEEIILFFTDLSGRLFYNPVIEHTFLIGEEEKKSQLIVRISDIKGIYQNIINRKESYKLYLRPKSDLTYSELDDLSNIDLENQQSGIFDYYDRHMIDYRGLLEKGLALEASESMKIYWKENNFELR